MTPKTLNELARTALSDIHVAGFVDRDESPLRFYGQFRLMYLELGGQLLELRCVEDTGTMSLALARAYANAPDLDEDMQSCVMSIRQFVLTDPDGPNDISYLRIWGAVFGDSSMACSAAELKLRNGQVVFVDPSYHFGIRLGGEEQKARWLQDWPGAASCPEWISSKAT